MHDNALFRSNMEAEATPVHGFLRDSDSRGFSVYSWASVFYGRDGRAPFFFLSASAALREVLVKAERRCA